MRTPCSVEPAAHLGHVFALGIRPAPWRRRWLGVAFNDSGDAQLCKEPELAAKSEWLVGLPSYTSCGAVMMAMPTTTADGAAKMRLPIDLMAFCLTAHIQPARTGTLPERVAGASSNSPRQERSD